MVVIALKRVRIILLSFSQFKMKLKINIFLFFVLTVGWLGSFHLFTKWEKSNFLKIHLINEQVLLIEKCEDLVSTSNPSIINEGFDLYNSLDEYVSKTLNGGQYEYSGYSVSLPTENTPFVLVEISAYKESLLKLKWLIQRISFSKTDLESERHQLFSRIEMQLSGLSNYFINRSQRIQEWKVGFFALWGFFTLATILFGIGIIQRDYHAPIAALNNYSGALKNGSVAIDIPKSTSQLYSELKTNLTGISSRLKYVDRFIKNIGAGNYQDEAVIEGEHDMLGKSLANLKDKLVKVSLEDKKRNWINEGLNKFNDIIHTHNEDVDGLVQILVKELVNYVSANQGSIFQIIEEGGEEKLALKASYAWDRQKYGEKILDLKSNLIGQAVLAKECLILKDVPEEFVRITSGLGEATPRFVIILPLVFNDICYGAIELASFTEFDETKTSFLKKLSENVALAILNISGKAATNKLLEESQELTEQLQIQGEELRQNEEELEAAQENLSRKLEEATLEMKSQLRKVEAEKMKNLAILEGNEDAVIMFRENGTIEFINSSAGELFGVDRKDIIGRQIDSIIPVEIINQNGSSQVFFTGNHNLTPITLRTEINMEDKYGEELSLLVTASNGEVEDETTFAFFIQRISVELF